MRYTSFLVDSGRWEGFALRPDDIIIATPAKCGTTWMQTICALLVFQTPDFPAPVDLLSPWLEMRLRRRADVHAMYDAQPHRRFIKSHTPLDGLPSAPGVTYICVGRDPRDVALSWNAHMDNIDLSKAMAALAAAIEPGDQFGPPPNRPTFTDEGEALHHWVDDDTPVEDVAMNLAGTIHHLRTFWEQRDRGDIVLVHYDDLKADLEGQMRALAARLGIGVAADRWPALVEAATFASMRQRADIVAPDTHNAIWKSTAGFFNRGTSGQWRTVAGGDFEAHYKARVAELCPPDLAAWLHRGTL